MVGVNSVQDNVSKKKKKTLAEEIAELSNPAPTFADEDPEAAFGFGNDARRVYDEEEDEDDILIEEKQDKQLFLRSDISLNDGIYSGKKSNRRALLDEDEPERFDLEAKERKEGDPFEDEEEEEEGEGEGDYDDLGGKSVLKREAMGESAEMDALDREYAQLRREEQEMLKTLKPNAEPDRKKGEAVAQQKMLWDRALELRIALQKPLQSSYRLPHPDKRRKLIAANEETERGFAALSAAASETLHLLLDIQQAIMAQNPAIQSAYRAAMDGNGKRKREEGQGNEREREEEGEDWEEVERREKGADAAWERMEKWYDRFVPFRDASIDRWHRKTMLSSGAAATKSRLRALSKSPSEQIAAAMSNPARMIERTRVKLGTMEVKGGVSNGDDDDDVAASSGDVETYDDADFYEQLLREFLESSDLNALGGSGFYAVRKLRNSKKKVVDRRASKGRKIRYTVMPKLVNFMAPEPMSVPPMAERLLGTLFGQKGEEREGPL